VIAALVSATLSVGTAAGDTPGAPVDQPTTSDQAKVSWIAAAQSADQLNEAVLVAEQQVTDAQAAATAAQAAADALVADVTAADAAVVAAQAQVDVYQPTLDAVAGASLRGARFSQMSSLLTADSADDYLDRTSALSQVAAETLATMDQARAARDAADALKASADGKHAAADASAKRDALDGQILQYEQLYSSLSVAERGEAIEEFATANLSPEAQQRLADQAAARAAAGLTDDVIANDISDLAVRDAPDVVGGLAAAAALTRRGLSYVWGATGPSSFDCSGLMLWAWAQAGIDIPRSSSEQATLPEVPLDELRAGDLVTFYSPVSHVGMYVGNGLVIHASMPGVPITVVPLDRAGPHPTGHRVPR